MAITRRASATRLFEKLGPVERMGGGWLIARQLTVPGLLGNKRDALSGLVGYIYLGPKNTITKTNTSELVSLIAEAKGLSELSITSKQEHKNNK